MKSQKITNNLRWTLRGRAERIKFKDQSDALQQENFSLSAEIYDAFYGKYLPLMEQLPEDAFEKGTYLRLRAASGNYVINIDLKEPKKVFQSFKINIDDPIIAQFILRIQDSSAKEKALEENRRKYAARVHSLLDGLSTTKQLVELMPEAEAWLTENNNGCSDIPLADAVAELRSL